MALTGPKQEPKVPWVVLFHQAWALDGQESPEMEAWKDSVELSKGPRGGKLGIEVLRACH